MEDLVIQRPAPLKEPTFFWVKMQGLAQRYFFGAAWLGSQNIIGVHDIFRASHWVGRFIYPAAFAVLSFHLLVHYQLTGKTGVWSRTRAICFSGEITFILIVGVG